jgi:hypothetical protein
MSENICTYKFRRCSHGKKCDFQPKCNENERDFSLLKCLQSTSIQNLCVGVTQYNSVHFEHVIYIESTGHLQYSKWKSGLMYFSNFKISYVSGAYISTMFCILNDFNCWNIFSFILILADNYLFAYVFLLYFPLGLRGFCLKYQT